MVTKQPEREGTMAGTTSGNGTGASWGVWAFCATAAGLGLVEAGTGVGYVGTLLAQIAVNVMGWMPALAFLPLKLAMGHVGTVDLLSRALPIGAAGFIVVLLGFTLNRHGRLARRQDAKRQGVRL
jgi:hypothetical protein